MNIKLKTFELVSLYRSTKEIRDYLKYLNHDETITEYLKDLSLYIGRKNAFFIKEQDEFIGFLLIASTKEERVKELMFAIDSLHRGKHKISSLLKKLIPYLFMNTDTQKLLITPMNPISKTIAIENGFTSEDLFHYYQEKEQFFQNRNSM